jgi:uncharacterized protein
MNQLFLRLTICGILLALMMTACSSLSPASQPPEPSGTPIQPLTAAGQGVDTPTLDGTWQGVISVPGQELGISVKITSKAEGVEATMDIPIQDAAGLPLHDVKVELPKVHFELLEGKQLAVMDGELGTDGKIAGKFTQAGVEGTFELLRQSAASAAAAPTPPATPTPYAIAGGQAEEITFKSGPFDIAGDLWLPEGEGPFPVVLFVHGDGPIDRTGWGMYLPLIERMLRAGYATFAWDKPGTGESTGEIDRSRLQEQRTQILLDAIEVMKAHPDIDPQRIGLWGASQAVYVMPRALAQSENIAFMICVSCPGMAGVDQMAYLIASQGTCAGAPEEKADQLKSLLPELNRARTYSSYTEYLKYREVLAALTAIGSNPDDGYKPEIMPEEAWLANDPDNENWWNPMEVIEQVTIPVLAFFGEKDTQVDPIQGAYAYREALERAGNANSRVELIPGVNHAMILAETGCYDELAQMVQSGNWVNAPEFLDTLEEWLRGLNR